MARSQENWQGPAVGIGLDNRLETGVEAGDLTGNRVAMEQVLVLRALQLRLYRLELGLRDGLVTRCEGFLKAAHKCAHAGHAVAVDLRPVDNLTD